MQKLRESLRESRNYLHEHFISTQPKRTSRRIKVIGQSSDALSKVVDGLMSAWKALGKALGKWWKKLMKDIELKCMSGDEIKNPCMYCLFGAIFIKVVYDKKLNNVNKI